MKNENNIKYKNAFDILNNVNNNKYTMKYIEENKHKNKNIENDTSNYLNYNNCKHKICNRSSSNINKSNNNSQKEKYDKHKNRSMKKENKNSIHKYKINNMSSSFNNNFTNIKTNKIVFIDLKDNDNNFLKSNLANENQNENNRYARNVNQNSGENINDNNIIFNSGGNANITNKYSNNTNNIRNNNMKLNFKNKLNNINKKYNNNNFEEKSIFRSRQNSNNSRSSKNEYANIPKNKFLNLSIQKLDKNSNNNNYNNYMVFEDNQKKNYFSSKKNLINIKDQFIKGLSAKDNSYYILSKSPILRLSERIIFSRSSLAIRKILSKENLLDDNKIILQNKIEELEKKIALCDKILNTPFTASKTADITLNFITSLQEIEFKDFPILLSNEEEKKYYINYLKIMYNILEIEIDIKNNGNSAFDQNNMILDLRKNLYSSINKKGFKSLRDYLYNIFITKKDYIKEIPKIAEINYLVNQVNNMFEIHNSLKICKFISFTMYLVKEIVQFGNNIKSSVELKIKAKNLIDIIIRKLKRYDTKYSK